MDGELISLVRRFKSAGEGEADRISEKCFAEVSGGKVLSTWREVIRFSAVKIHWPVGRLPTLKKPADDMTKAR
jgi:hypothetical protein